MNIAQGLRRIKQLKGQMAELTARAASVVSYQQDKEPDFKFDDVRGEIVTVREELIGLEAAVARANATTIIEVDGKRMTIAEAIRRLQEAKAEKAWLAGLRLRYGTEETSKVDYDTETGRPVRRKETVVWVSRLTEPNRVELQRQLQDRFDRVNDAVETANHRTDLPEEA